MRKIMLLGALTAVASLSLGCALTDYPAIDPPVNKSHGIVDCTGSHDRIANTQQTTEPLYLDLFFRDPAIGGDFGPFTLTGPVDKHTAKEWGRFIGPFAAVQGAGVSGGIESGQWEMATVKDLADGSTVITTHFQQLPGSGFPPFSCGFGGPNNSSATAGGVMSQFLVPPANAVPGAYMIPEAVAIDATAGNQWGANVVAMTPNRAANGFSTTLGSAGRGAESNLMATPITRRAEASLGRALNGNVETLEVEGWRLSAWGEMTDEGIVLHATSIVAPNGASYQAGEEPVAITVGQIGSRTVQVETTPAESLKLALFAREAGIGDQVFELPAHVEGIPLPAISFQIGSDAIDRRIDALTELLAGEGGAGFGG